MKFDFGKFDYGIVDGRVVLYDVNKTSSQARISKETQTTHRELADGIWAYL